jgi:hypothetical protein
MSTQEKCSEALPFGRVVSRCATTGLFSISVLAGVDRHSPHIESMLYPSQPVIDNPQLTGLALQHAT